MLSDAAYHFVLGTGEIAALAWFAVLVAPWLVASGVNRAAVTGAAVALVVVLAPGFGNAFDLATGAGAVVWRLMWVAPVPVMVGLLASAPLPAEDRITSRLPTLARPVLDGIPALLVVALVLVWGTPLTAQQRSVSIKAEPVWKYPAVSLNEARAIAKTRPGPGPVLSSLSVMRALSLVSSEVHAVDPRPSYLRILDEGKEEHQARVLLTRLASATRPEPSSHKVRQALDTLDVSLACFRPGQAAQRSAVAHAGWSSTDEIAGLACYRR